MQKNEESDFPHLSLSLGDDYSMVSGPQIWTWLPGCGGSLPPLPLRHGLRESLVAQVPRDDRLLIGAKHPSFYISLYGFNLLLVVDFATIHSS